MSMTRVTVMVVLTGALLGPGLPLNASQGPGNGPVLRVYDRATPGLVLPTVVTGAHPQYTRAAFSERITGSATVDLTVGVDGKVRDVLLVKSVDAVHGLDEAAAASRHVFTPGLLNGQPVAVRVRLDLNFDLR
jgi:TonB family protein